MMQSVKKQKTITKPCFHVFLPDSFALAESSGVDPVYMKYAEHRW